MIDRRLLPPLPSKKRGSTGKWPILTRFEEEELFIILGTFVNKEEEEERFTFLGNCVNEEGNENEAFVES